MLEMQKMGDIVMLEQRIVQFLKGTFNDNVDAAHDLGHLTRVASNCKNIHKHEGGNADVILVASYFHDIVSLPKNAPDRHRSSQLAAQKTLTLLAEHFPDFPAHLYDAVEEAIVCHSYSANVKPESIEAKIVQDADRLDALGAVGLARTFYIAGKLNLTLFDIDDPFAEQRALNDKAYALDHFYTKLLKLPDTMNTGEGKRIAETRAEFLINYIQNLRQELGLPVSFCDSEIVK